MIYFEIGSFKTIKYWLYYLLWKICIFRNKVSVFVPNYSKNIFWLGVWEEWVFFYPESINRLGGRRCRSYWFVWLTKVLNSLFKFTFKVDRLSFPCGCHPENCWNPNGRTSFNSERVKNHYLRTKHRLDTQAWVSVQFFK